MMDGQLFPRLLPLLGILTLADAQACYYAGGAPATDYTFAPCSTGSNASACCIAGENDACLSNGMCYYPAKNYFYRGACTDPTWSSDGCPHYCPTDSPTSWFEITRCGTDSFCCQGNSSTSCCDDLNEKFTTPDYWVVNSYGQSVNVPGAIPSPSSTSTTSSATSATAQPTSSSESGNVSGGGGGLTTGQLVGAIVGPVCTLLGVIIAAVIRAKCAGKNKGNKDETSPNGEADAAMPPSAVATSTGNAKIDETIGASVTAAEKIADAAV